MKITIIVWKLKKEYKKTDNGPYYLTFGLNKDPETEYKKILKTKVGKYYSFLTWFETSLWTWFWGILPFVHQYEEELNEQ